MGKPNRVRKPQKFEEEVRKLQKRLDQIKKELKQDIEEDNQEEIISNSNSESLNNNFQQFIARYILKQHPKFKLIIIKRKKLD